MPITTISLPSALQKMTLYSRLQLGGLTTLSKCRDRLTCTWEEFIQARYKQPITTRNSTDSSQDTAGTLS